MNSRILILDTGGTIGMAPTETGYGPCPGHLARCLSSFPEFRHDRIPEWELETLSPIIDSSDMTPENWLAIARRIEARHAEFDGFVVLHGTDTMAWTASALSLMFEGLGKPVILTGSQIPLAEPRTDGRSNLFSAMELAGSCQIPEVMVLFGRNLFRGNRATKVDADGIQAFDSPNFPPLATIGTRVELHAEHVRIPQNLPARVSVREVVTDAVACLRLFPGISASIVENLLRPPIRGVVLETYGSGNAPCDAALLAAFRKAAEDGVVIAACTQCRKGAVRMESYAAGHRLAESGVVGCGDMTVEAAVAKLVYLFSRNLDAAAIRKAMTEDLRGEITVEAQ